MRARPSSRSTAPISMSSRRPTTRRSRRPISTPRRIILDALRRLTPECPIIAEEEVSAGRVPDVGDCFWLVDPLDGTREFLNRNGEFTVNIALIHDRRPVLGVVHAPDRGTTYTGCLPGGATRQKGEGPIGRSGFATPPPEGLTVVASRRHGSGMEIDHFLMGRAIAERVSFGSSLKFCVVASGEADLYPRFGPTMEWDTAAGHAVLAAAGGCITNDRRHGFPLPQTRISSTPTSSPGAGCGRASPPRPPARRPALPAPPPRRGSPVCGPGPSDSR